MPDPWRENIERVRETLISLANTPFLEATAALDALTAQIEELEEERDLWCDQEQRLNAAYSEIQAAEQRVEELERERDHAKIEVGRESELRNDAEQRVKELAEALEAISTGAWGAKAHMANYDVRTFARAALAQSDPAEDA